MIDNELCIKTIVANNYNPQCLEDFKQINKIINTSPISMVSRKYKIILNIEVITKDGILMGKEATMILSIESITST